MTRGIWLAFSACIALSLAFGCGTPRTAAPSVDDAAKGKVKALTALADELEKDQEGLGAVAALEQFRTMSLDAEKHPELANQIADIYRQRIQGKYQGSVAQELQSDISPYLVKKQ